MAFGLVAAGAFVGLVPMLTGHVHLFGLIPYFHLDLEGTVPATFSAGLMLTTATVAFLHGAALSTCGDRLGRRWKLLAAALVYTFFDETVGLHELTIDPLQQAFHTHGTIFTFAWVLLGIPLVGGFGIYFWPVIVRLDVRARIGFVAAVAVYLGGAVGVELAGGWVSSTIGEENAIYQAIIVAEEGMEIIGLTLLLRQVLRIFADGGRPRVVRLEP